MKHKETAILFRMVSGATEGLSLQEINIKLLTGLAYRHKLAYPMLLLAKKHHGLFTDEEIGRLSEHNYKIARQSLIQLQEVKKIDALFMKNSMRYICIKGPQLSRMLYGREAMKESVDLDIVLVNGNDLPVVHALLTDAGYTRSNLNDYSGTFRRKLFLIAKREVSYYNPGLRIAIDLHIRPGANTYLTEDRFSDFFQRLKQYDLEGTPVTVLSDEAYFVYLCYHGALHQFGRLAWLADIRAFLKLKEKEMDFTEVHAIAGKWWVTNCVDLALRLIKDYFEEEYVPITSPASWRMNYLATSCRNILYHRPGYGTTISGRINKTIYIQLLLEGFAARIDWLYGIVMRKLVPLLAKKAQTN